MINAGKKGVDVWGGTSYKLPLPYLRSRDSGTATKKPAEEKKSLFAPGPGDGPQFKFPKAKKGMDYQINVFGKDGKEPPISYLPMKEWGGKKAVKREEAKGEEKKGTKGGRGSFIDAIFYYGEKYKYPGPDAYFKKDKEKAKENAKDADKSKDKKKAERPNFLSDCEYLGLNNPAPGTYNLKDTWAEINNKKKPATEEKKKPNYVAGDWRVKKQKDGPAPGLYEITRLMTLAAPKDGETKDKAMKRFASIPVFERPKLGIINKVRRLFSF